MKRRSIQSSVLSFVLCSRTRERTRARKSIAFLVIFIQRGKHHPSGFLFHRARAFKRERYARKTYEEQEQRHHDSPNFDASLGNDVQANGLRNSGLGNREHYVCECLSEYKVSTWVSFMARYLWFFFCLFGWKLLFLCRLVCSFPRREREECLFSRGADSFLKSFFCFSFSSSSLSTFFSQKENKQSSFLSFASLSVFCFFSFVRFTQERLAF